MAISKDEVARLAAQGQRGQLLARMGILADVPGYLRGDPPAVAGAPPAPVAPAAPAPPPPPPAAPVSNPPASPLTFRERVQALGKTDPLAARLAILADPRAYVTGVGEGPPPPAQTTVELSAEILTDRLSKSAKAEQARILRELGVDSLDAAKAKMGVPPPPAPAAPAVPAAPAATGGPAQ
jgi:hypothetical protein